MREVGYKQVNGMFVSMLSKRCLRTNLTVVFDPLKMLRFSIVMVQNLCGFDDMLDREVRNLSSDYVICAR